MSSLKYVSAHRILFTFLLLALVIPVFAQHHEGNQADAQAIRVGKRGEVRISSALRVGDVVLQPGEYQFQHKDQAGEHVVAFRRMNTNPYIGNTTVGNEIAWIKCRLEPLGEKAKQTQLLSRAGAGGENILVEVQVRGENVKHVF